MPLCTTDDGVKINYDLHGNGPEKVILIMGLLTDGLAWKTQVDYLLSNSNNNDTSSSTSAASSSSSSSSSSSRYQFVTYDNRGIARSSSFNLFTSPCTTTRMAQDALCLLRELKWNEFHIVGVSMGGMIAQQLALAVPQYEGKSMRILSLTLIATHAGGLHATAPMAGVLGIAKSIVTQSNEARITGMMNTVYSPAAIADPTIYSRLYKHHQERIATRVSPSISGLLGHPFAVSTHHLSYPQLLTLRYSPYPILILVGESDILVRIINSLIMKKILGAYYVVIENGGHALPTERPEECGKELLKQFERGRKWKEDEKVVYAQGKNVLNGSGKDATVRGMGDEEKMHLLGMDSSRYGREIEALQCCCKHSHVCLIHNLRGGLKGFLIGWILHRFFLYPSSPLHSASLTSFFSSFLPSSVSSLPYSSSSYDFALYISCFYLLRRSISCIYRSLQARNKVNEAKNEIERRKNYEGYDKRLDLERVGFPEVGFGFNFPKEEIGVAIVATAILAWKLKQHWI